MRRACVRADIDEAVERPTAAVGLHRFEHVRVFQKRGFRALVKQLGHFAVADRKVAGKAEQVVTVVSVSGVTRWLDQIDMPWLRSPAGAPVPVLAQPTSRYTVEGGFQVANCQRSTLPVKLPALAYNDGATKSMSQRPTRTPSGRRSVLVGAVASRGSPASVFLCT